MSGDNKQNAGNGQSDNNNNNLRIPPRQLRAQLSEEFDIHGRDEVLPSPPYHPHATFPRDGLPPPDSPAYKSTATFMEHQEHHERDLDRKRHPDEDEDDEDDGHDGDHEGTGRRMVHYPSDVKRAPSYHAPLDPPPKIGRVDTGLSSRASSIATDDEDDDEDYDWSGEEDLVDEEAKFEQQMGIKQKRTGWGFKRIMTLLFGTLIGSIFMAGVFVTGPILIHFYWYKPHPTEHRKYVQDNVQAWLFWAAAQLIVSWFLALLVDLVPGVVRLFISLAWGHVSEYVKTRIELYNSVKDNIKPVLYAASAWVSWNILFDGIYDLYHGGDTDKSRAQYTKRVYEVIEFIFFLALVVCIQRMLSHFIAFTFHQTAFKERLDAVNETLRVVEVLRNHRPKRRGRSGKNTPTFASALFTPFTERDGFFGSGSRPGTPTQDGSAGTKGKGKQRTISRDSTPAGHARQGSGSPHSYPPGAAAAATHRRSSSSDEDIAAKAAKALKTAVLHDARNLSGKGSESGALVWDVTSASEAKRLARSIFYAFRQPGKTYLVPSDFEAAFPSTEEAQAAFKVFDKDNNGDMSRAEIKTTLLKVYKERRSLSRSMRDVGMALKTLDRILLFFALVILFFISLSVFSVSVGNSLTSLYSLGIALSFIFKNSASSAFDAIMFLFVTHPFDTGDRCFIGNENLVVKQMGLFATVFTRSDGSETYYFNSQLFNMFISNCRRSGKTAENLVLQVAWRTPTEKLDQLEKCMNEWLQTEENRWYEPSTSVTLQHIGYQRYLECTIGIGHNGNWQDWGMRNARKTAFHAAVQHYCRQLGITCYGSPVPYAYVDPNTHQLLAEPVGAYSPDEQQQQQGPLDQADEDAAAQQPLRTLGFLPPESQRADVRARRSKSRKVMLRTMGADM